MIPTVEQRAGNWVFSMTGSPEYRTVLILPSTYEPSPGGHNYLIRELVLALGEEGRLGNILVPIYGYKQGRYYSSLDPDLKERVQELYARLNRPLTITFFNAANILAGDISIRLKDGLLVEAAGFEARIFMQYLYPDLDRIRQEVSMLPSCRSRYRVLVPDVCSKEPDRRKTVSSIRSLVYDYLN
ncbi:hypothetical protein [Rhizobium leguminosarum]|uniref:hypothetical protein n=1 Tax=Rhizobium leguminosarum TaxID=384 RepID=UPI00049146AD|nr:hypothetical protein [Rhizobium leguminosarum]